jgi:hypothetical protein
MRKRRVGEEVVYGGKVDWRRKGNCNEKNRLRMEKTLSGKLVLKCRRVCDSFGDRIKRRW